MHGQGNDFIMLNGISQQISLTPVQIQRIADRHVGVGCDQLLLVESATSGNADFRYRIFNADGGEVEQCGNGARCFAQFVRDEGLTTLDEIRVETLSGLIVPRFEADGRVTVNMGHRDLRQPPSRSRPTAKRSNIRSICGTPVYPLVWYRWAIRMRCRWLITSIPLWFEKPVR